MKLKMNPIIEKELKTNMRGWKAPLLITFYLGLLLVVIYLFFLVNDQLSSSDYYGFGPRIAIMAFDTLAFFQLMLILFITPILTGGAISGERERQTFDLLLCTSYPTHKIILGKVFVPVANVLLLIVASFPIMSIVFMYGGVEISNLLSLFLFYVGTAVMISSLGVFYSTLFKKTVISIVMSYLTILIFSIGTIVIMFLTLLFINRLEVEPTYTQISAFLFANPFYGFASVGASSDSIFGEIFYAIDPNNNIVIKSWMINLGFNMLFSVLLVFLAAKRLRLRKK